MAIRRKVGGFCRVLLLAASVTALSVTAARPQDLGDLNNRILENPNDVELNLSYARAAEELGSLRLALAAYERVLINHRDNEEAQRGFTRVRRVLEPTHTSLRVEIGAKWDSNPRNVGWVDDEAYSVFTRATLADERRIDSQRWRTSANFEAEITPDIQELNYAYLGAQTGPIFDLTPNVAAIPTVGVAVATLDDSFYYDDINLGVTFEGQQDGVSFWARFRAGWREFGEDSTADEGAYAEAMGGVSVPRVASESDTFVAVPWVRWSDIEGSTFNFLNEEIAPGRYEEYGLELTYNYRVNDNVLVSAGVHGHDRTYPDTVVNGEERRDTYVAPQASVTLTNVLPCACAIKVGYRHRDNSSNDVFSEYDADQVSVSLFASF